MDLNTYTGLSEAIASELNRDDLTTAIPLFIALCETQTERQLRVRQMLKTVSITIDNEFESLPTGFLETRSFFVQTNPITPLQFRTIESMEQFKRSLSAPGTPSEYTVIGDQFQFLRVPDGSYTASLTYYESIPRLSGALASNWLLALHPDIYFYGALINSAPYLKDDGRISVWAQYYQGAVEALKISDARSQSAASGLKAQARMF